MGLKSSLIKSPEIYVQTFAPGGNLTTSNFEAALNAAVTYAYAQPEGGTVVMPSGLWPMTSTVNFPGTGNPYAYGRHVSLVGQGKLGTYLDYRQASGFNSSSIALNISGAPGSWNHNSLFANFGILGPSVGLGMRVNGVLELHLENINISQFGTGLKVDYVTGWDMNSQNCYFDFVQIGQCIDCSMELEAATQFTLTQFVSNQCHGPDILLGSSNIISILSGMFQSVNAYASFTTKNPNVGSNRVYAANFYHEGSQASLLKAYPPTGSGDSFTFTNFVAGGYDTLIDADGSNYSDIRVGVVWNGPAKYLKGRRLANVTFDHAPDPFRFPSQYDMDDVTRCALVVRDNLSGKIHQGSLSRSLTLTEILRPYAVEIFDVGLANKREIVSGKVQSLTGLIHGTSWAAPSAARRPIFTASDPAFNGRATVGFRNDDQSILSAALNTPIASGKYAGLFAIFRYTIPTTATGTQGAIISVSDGHDNYNATNIAKVGYSDGTVTANYVFTSFRMGSGDYAHNIPDSTASATVIADPTMLGPHAVMATPSTVFFPDVAAYALYDNSTSPSYQSLTFSPSTVTMGNIYVGFADPSAGFTPSNFPTADLAYVAIFNAWIPPGVARQAMELAAERYGIALVPGEVPGS
jgi:hypothetical protein